MASKRMEEALSAAWSNAEYRARRYEPGSFAPLPRTEEAQARIDRVNAAQRYADDHTDREVAREFPDVVRGAVSPAYWDRIKP